MIPYYHLTFGIGGDTLTGKRKVISGTSQSSGEGPQNQGKLAREQANSELDMSQTLFILNILEKGNSWVQIPAHCLVAI